MTVISICAPSPVSRSRTALPDDFDPAAVGPATRAVGPATLTKTPVLIIDEERILRENCANVLAQEGYDVVTCGRGEDALEIVRHRRFAIAFVELNMSRVDGLTLMRALLKTNSATLVVMMSDNPNIDSGLAALREGAWDYLPKPFSAIQLQVLAGRASLVVQAESGTADLDASYPPTASNAGSLPLLGSAPGFRKALEVASRVARTNASVFITGESGCGKELVARFIHDHSQRAGGAFVAVNCGAMPEGLLESEMFGHQKGSFTGAWRDEQGLLEAASGGTLFLDELLEMPKTAQTKLLRVLQDGVVRRVGSKKTDAIVNVRFIAATNASPAEALARGDLRADLLYRLRVVPIHLPPLRERQEDIPLLAAHFLQNFWRQRRETGRSPRLSRSALDALAAHGWPGNVRELRNVIERVAVLAEPGAEIRNRDLLFHEEPRDAPPPAAEVPAIPAEFGVAYHRARDRMFKEFQIQYMRWLMGQARGNMSAASRIARVDRATLYRILQRVGLERELDRGVLSERAETLGSNAPRSPAQHA